MQTVLALAMRLTGEMARGNLVDIRRRLIRSITLAVFALVLVIVALALACAALAVALASWIGIVPALLSLAAVAAIAALILMLMLSMRGHTSRRGGFGLPKMTGRNLKVAPVTIVIGALAVGLLLGRRKG